jgi:hypothetical protein
VTTGRRTARTTARRARRYTSAWANCEL